MQAVGKITVQRIGNDVVYSDETGQKYTIRGRAKGHTLDIDPRIDLTRPIYEQVMKLAAKDRAKKRKSPIKAA